jgi:hypothetical protein
MSIRAVRFPAHSDFGAFGFSITSASIDGNVGYRGQTGKHLLALSFTGFDPKPT